MASNQYRVVGGWEDYDGVERPDGALVVLEALQAEYARALGQLALVGPAPTDPVPPRVLGSDIVRTERGGQQRQVSVEDLREAIHDELVALIAARAAPSDIAAAIAGIRDGVDGSGNTLAKLRALIADLDGDLAGKATGNDLALAIAALKGDAPASGNTLKKLSDLIAGLESALSGKATTGALADQVAALKGGVAPAGDTLAKLLALIGALQVSLADKATPADIAAAIAQLTAGSPAELNTFLETYDRFLAGDSALSALTTVVSQKAATADLMSSTALTNGLATVLVQAGNALGNALAALKNASDITCTPEYRTAAGAVIPSENAVARALLDFVGDAVNVRRFLSTDAGYADAVNTALLSGKDLYWPAGTYTTTASIPNLHKVRSRGPGIIKRTSPSVGDCFYPISPDPATNDSYVTYHVNPTVAGAAANDGLTPETAFATFTQVNAALLKKGGDLDGLYRVRLSGDTHTGVGLDSRIKPRYALEIRGAHVGGWPSVPTTIIDGAVPINGESQAGGRGIDLSGGHNVALYDIKVQNYESGYGLSAAGGTALLANMHFYNNFYQINPRSGENIVFLTSVKINGVFTQTGCRVEGAGTATGKNSGSFGLFIQFNSQVTANFQNNSFANTLQIFNCGQGIWSNEGCYGHLDHTWVDNCGTGYATQRGAGNNCDGMRIWNCNVGADIMPGSDPLDNGIDWGETSGNANTVKIRFNGGKEFYRSRDALELYKINGFDSNISITASAIGTTETAIWTPMKIKAGDIGPIAPASIPGAPTSVAGIPYKVIHQIFHKLGLVVQTAAMTQNATISLYIGSVAAGNLIGAITTTALAQNAFAEFEFNTHFVSTGAVKTANKRTTAGAPNCAYTTNNTLSLRNGNDLPIILTIKIPVAETSAAVLSFVMAESWSSLGRCPY